MMPLIEEQNSSWIKQMKKITLITLGIVLLAAACNRSQRVIQPQAPASKTAQAQKPNLPVQVLPLHTVGQITRHAAGFINQKVRMQGYLLKKESGYIIFSDEPGGGINQYDLPVVGPGIETIQPKHKYELQGTFLDHGLKANNGNLDHLELLITPKLIQY